VVKKGNVMLMAKYYDHPVELHNILYGLLLYQKSSHLQ